ncbi:MAG TPA: aminofutalosine synthase MqnE, partial [Saprospiraceae bacterium]|nr:aminofutalosine synthase MqnE [Saprospiraceae bacterium]
MQNTRDTADLTSILSTDPLDPELTSIREKVLAGTRINEEEALILFEKAPLPFLSLLADSVRTRLHGNKTYFNRNFHIEPTNVCIYTCKFCSYSRLIKNRSDGW